MTLCFLFSMVFTFSSVPLLLLFGLFDLDPYKNNVDYVLQIKQGDCQCSFLHLFPEVVKIHLILFEKPSESQGSHVVMLTDAWQEFFVVATMMISHCFASCDTLLYEPCAVILMVIAIV